MRGFFSAPHHPGNRVNQQELLYPIEQEAFVAISKPDKDSVEKCATKIYVLDKDRSNIFAIVVTLSQLGLTVVDAYINKASDNRYFDMFTVLDSEGAEVVDLGEEASLNASKALADPAPPTSDTGLRVSRRLKELKIPAGVT